MIRRPYDRPAAECPRARSRPDKSAWRIFSRSSSVRCDMPVSEKTRIVILGGGFGGVTTARRLERLCKRRSDVEIVLVSRDNFLLMTPLLFEVFSGTLDVRH